MYYTTSGAYRKTKMLIDYANIFLTVAICVMFILILFMRSKSGILFPLIFLAGAIVNGTTGVKRFMDKQKVSAVLAWVVTVIFAAMSLLCFLAL